MNPNVLIQALRPKRMVIFSFILALLFDFIPFPPLLDRLLPETTAVFVIYWILHRPQWIGIGMAFLFGLTVDIGTQTVLGQHALAYTVMAFLIDRKRRKIVLDSFGIQAVTVFGALLLTQILLGLLALFQHQQDFALWPMLFSSTLAGLCWPLLNKGMLALSRLRSRA